MPASTSAADVRRLIYGGSTRSGYLSPADLVWFRANEPNLYLAAAAAAEAEAQQLVATGNRKVGDLEISYDNSSEWRALAKQLRIRGLVRISPYSGGISVSDKDSQAADTDYDAPSFKRGQFDNNSSTGGSTAY